MIVSIAAPEPSTLAGAIAGTVVLLCRRHRRQT
jgi:hypothetical protein